MAIKDEYEVGRLFTDGRFEREIREDFEDGAKLTFHLAPPLLAKRDPLTGHLLKREYGPWVFKILKILAGLCPRDCIHTFPIPMKVSNMSFYQTGMVLVYHHHLYIQILRLNQPLSITHSNNHKMSYILTIRSHITGSSIHVSSYKI